LNEEKNMEKKTYYILPRDQYGQPNGSVDIVELTDAEYQEHKAHGEYILDNYMSALCRAQD
jgi:hypothetical protein